MSDPESVSYDSIHQVMLTIGQISMLRSYITPPPPGHLGPFHRKASPVGVTDDAVMQEEVAWGLQGTWLCFPSG